MGFGGGDLGEDLVGKLWRGQQGAGAVFTLSPPAAPFMCRGFAHVCAMTWGGRENHFHSKTNLILGVFLVRQYNSAPLVGQFGEGA